METAVGRNNASSNLRIAGGVAGVAEASSAPPASSGVPIGGFFDPSSPSFWTAVLYLGAVSYLLWVRFVWRGAAL